MKIVNLEINEITPKLIFDYISKNPNSNLASLRHSNLLEIYTTLALDIEKERLYPSQTWASFSTGKPYSNHKCYWYSDNLNPKDLIWNKLTSIDKNVGIVGSIHSSKLPEDLFFNKRYNFYLPDCFSKVDTTKPENFKDFQSLNNNLVGNSARVTSIFSIFKNLLNFGIKCLFSPGKFGLSSFSFKMILKIIFNSIKYKNKELLRMAQFPLLGSIYSELFIKYKPDYSSLFTNHIAGNMHRYWYAYDNDSFNNKDKYSHDWIKKHKRAIPLGFDLLDEYIGYILKKKEFKGSTICITSSMGQEANPEFDKKFLAKYDGKISNINLFLECLSKYQKEIYDLEIEFQFERNMAPQYGFNFEKYRFYDLDLITKSISEFVSSIGLKNNIDKEGSSIVLTIDPYNDLVLQEKMDMVSANMEFKKYGFTFFPIEDHHSGAHCPEGLMMIINPDIKFKKEINKRIDKNLSLNYLDFHNIVLNYFK